jgi:hypothetical protein
VGNRPGPHDKKIRAQVLDELRVAERAANGNVTTETYDTLAAKYKVSRRAMQEWQHKENAGPRGVPPPATDSQTTRGTRYKSAPGRRPITEQTAGMLVAGLFTVCAILDGETWILTQTERDSLAGPLADTMRALPVPVADAVNTYAAPITFSSALVTVIAHKVRVRNEKRKAPPPAPRPPIANGVAPPVPTYPPGVRAPFAAAPPANGRASQVDPTLAAALDAARGGLTHLDASPEDGGENMLS